MECKFPLPFQASQSIHWINRYIMECKYISLCHFARESSELIDTLWNVNISGIWFANWWKSELIDTLWNVNDNITTDITDKVIRINRYIMECKWRRTEAEKEKLLRINRYIMECK